MKVRIHNTRTSQVYEVNKPSDCKDRLDKSLFQTCCEMQTTITMGCMVAEYIN